MSTPFNTGKVAIGCKAAAPPRHEYHDADALRLQAALLGNVKRVDWDGIVIAASVMAVLIAVLWGRA